MVCDDIVYCSAGYDVGGGACKITKDGDGLKAEQIWYIKGNKTVANHWSTPVYKDGYLYGMFSFKQLRRRPAEVRRGRHRQSDVGQTGLRRRAGHPRQR